MSPFAKHGIRHLSPSSLCLYQANPSLWCVRYLLNVKDEDGAAAMWRGKAVEDGLSVWLYKRDAEAANRAALDSFEANAMGEASDEVVKERASVPGMLSQAIAAYHEIDVSPNATQLKVEHWFDGIDVPCIGYADFTFEPSVDDLKTTRAVPSEKPRGDHRAQVALYATCLKRPGRVVYVSEKKHSIFTLTDDDVAAGLADLRRAALGLRRLLNGCSTPEAAVGIFAPNFDDFRWSDVTRQAVLAAWHGNEVSP